MAGYKPDQARDSDGMWVATGPRPRRTFHEYVEHRKRMALVDAVDAAALGFKGYELYRDYGDVLKATTTGVRFVDRVLKKPHST